ncbi:MAG: glycosyltransferase family 4 protein [Lentisphaeria bacterium]|nr:glycosyltransferase family 4 protein [Lentisphaeria bacterium]
MSSTSDPDILLLTRYGRLGASSRLRYFNYLRGLQREKFSVRAENFFCDDYLRKLYLSQSGRWKTILAAYFRRLRSLCHAPKQLLIEYELFPGLPYPFEEIFLRRRRYILNFDDDVWCKYHHKRLLHNKYDQLVRNAAGVIAANDYLLNKVRQLNSKVIKIPTAIDLGAYHWQDKKFRRLTLVWIGNPATFPYLCNLAPVLEKLRRQVDFQLLIIGGKQLNLKDFVHLDAHAVDWSIRRENELLCRCHIGIMPLPENDEFARGKSAYKLIQYSAAGLPMVASDVGENCNVITNDFNGFLAGNDDEFLRRLRQLTSDEPLRRRLGKNARQNATKFSIEKYLPIMSNFIRECFESNEDAE